MSNVPRKIIVYCEDDEDDTIAFAYKRSRIHKELLMESKRPHPTLEDICSTPDTTTRVLLRRVFFLNEEKSRYVSVGFYPTDNYQVLAEFGGPQIAPITLTEKHVKSLAEHLPALCRPCTAANTTPAKTDNPVCSPPEPTRLPECTDTKKCVSFKLPVLRYVVTVLHFVQVQQTQYIPAQNGVLAFAIAALGSIEFVEPPHTTTSLIPYGQLFKELKTILI